MNSIELIKMFLGMSEGWVMGLVEDIKDEPLTPPTPKGGNHPLWVIGHLAFSEGNMVSRFVEGKPNPVADWASAFDQGTEPSTNAGDYPPIDEIIAKMKEIRANTMKVVDGLTPEDLAKPSHAPEEMKEYFGTIGQCLAAIPVHFAFHGGQVADARRAAGRRPLMA